MKFDFNKTLELIKGGLMSPEATWRSYLAGNPSWQQTLVVLTGPLILANVLLGVILFKLIGGYSPFGVETGFFSMLLRGLITAALGFTIAVLVFNFLAGVFKGKTDFSRAVAAVSLAAIPAWIAGIVGAAIPWLGGLVTLAGAIVTLVFLYKIMPIALEVPEDKRVMHFVLSLILIFVLNVVVGLVLNRGELEAAMDERRFGDNERGRTAAPASGMFGEVQRQAELMEAAGNDRYDPPSDGEVTEAQVREVVKVLEKSRELVAEHAARLEAMQKEIEEKDNPSPADIARMYQGMGTAMSLHNTEMEVVKTGGGNWAEHQWVKEQLRVARIQRGEGSDAIEHNYALYQEYEEELQDSI